MWTGDTSTDRKFVRMDSRKESAALSVQNRIALDHGKSERHKMTWHNLAYESPEPGALIEFKSGGTGYIRDIPPEANSYSIQWRYTGIAKEFGYGKPTNLVQGAQAQNAMGFSGANTNALLANCAGLGASSVSSLIGMNPMRCDVYDLF
jgi:hypothetical protein